MLDGEKYYQKKSSQYARYKFSSGAKFVKGEMPNFYQLVKKYSNKDFIALDLGCGSGELALELSPFFKKIVGIDPVKRYIDTAQKEKESKNIINVEFIVAPGENLPFGNESFDIIICSRGPLSASLTFFREAKRVLKSGGLFIEETIGENDKMELKEIFGRGQNYPPSGTKLAQIKNILNKEGFELLYSKYFLYYQNYHSIENVINTLERAPIIPDFDKDKDIKNIRMVRNRLSSKKGIILSSHRLHWAAKLN